MTNLHGWRVVSGWPVRPNPGPSGRRRTLASRLVCEAPPEADTSDRDATPAGAALGVAIVVGMSVALWAAIIGGCYLLVR